MGVDRLSDDEYARLWYVRCSSDDPEEGTAGWQAWKRLERRAESAVGTTRERRCWHEAGHALVGHRVGRRVIKVTSWRTWFDPTDPQFPHEIEDLIAVAGYVAELMRFQLEQTCCGASCCDPGKTCCGQTCCDFGQRCCGANRDQCCDA